MEDDRKPAKPNGGVATAPPEKNEKPEKPEKKDAAMPADHGNMDY